MGTASLQDDTKLERVEGTPDAAIQRDLDRLEHWTERNHMKFNKRKYQYILGAKWLESGTWGSHSESEWDPPYISLTERDLEVLVNTRLSMSQQCAHVAKKTSSRLGCISKSTDNMLRKEILPLCSALVRPNLQSWLQFWTPQYRTVTDLLEQVHARDTDMIKGLECLSYEQRLRKLGLFNLEKRKLRRILS
ncbi:hypothetical protein QYF61_005213, partial [Mycteria americana]